MKPVDSPLVTFAYEREQKLGKMRWYVLESQDAYGFNFPTNKYTFDFQEKNYNENNNNVISGEGSDW